ncbi:MAG: tetratricopeptide repeat protein [Bacteroidales bacterium]|nr:tetratricopeptide repeat protein [Bacteroidales bacterium]
MKNSRIHQIILLTLIVLFYCNTLSLDFALDDRMVVMENEFALDGSWDGVRSIFTEDTFTGYFGNDKSVVVGGRYRPMSQLSFMLEATLFGKKIKEKIGDVHDFDNLHDPSHEEYFKGSFLSFFCHLMNMVYYILLCLLVYDVLRKLFRKYQGDKWFQSLAFLAAVLFALHPIHTEAVANVKGRDEIFAMLGATAALWCSLQYVDTRKWWYLVLSLLAITFGLFSKENAITYLAVVPLSLYFYQNEHKKKIDYLTTLLPIVVGSIFFVWVRSRALGGLMPEDSTQNILNNPFIHSTKAQEIATVLITWGMYFKLLFFPHPLTHDYYPHQIAITDFSNPLVWVILAGCVALVVYALLNLKKKSVVSYGILFFVITFSITSNLLFNVGTFMNERFVFMASLGFTLIVGYWIYLLSVAKSVSMQKLSIGIIAVVGLLFGIKTFTRNFVWDNDFSLFLTDVKTSHESIKCNISAGGSKLQIWKKSHKERDKVEAYRYLEKALKLDDHALNAYLLLGELMYLDNNKAGAYQAYRNATLIDPNNKLAQDNLALMVSVTEDDFLKPITALLDEGIALQDPNKIQEAYRQIDDYLKEHPESLIALNVKGNVLGRGMNRLDEAIAIYEQVIAKDPTFASAYENMGIAYAIKGEFDRAEQLFKKALEFAPDNQNILFNLESLQKDRAMRSKAGQ